MTMSSLIQSVLYQLLWLCSSRPFCFVHRLSVRVVSLCLGIKQWRRQRSGPRPYPTAADWRKLYPSVPSQYLGTTQNHPSQASPRSKPNNGDGKGLGQGHTQQRQTGENCTRQYRANISGQRANHRRSCCNWFEQTQEIELYRQLCFGERSRFARKSVDLKIKLKEDGQTIDEVVVTGLSKRKKSSFTGNYVSVKGADLQNTPFFSATLVAGRAVGDRPRWASTPVRRGAALDPARPPHVGVLLQNTPFFSATLVAGRAVGDRPRWASTPVRRGAALAGGSAGLIGHGGDRRAGGHSAQGPDGNGGIGGAVTSPNGLGGAGGAGGSAGLIGHGGDRRAGGHSAQGPDGNGGIGGAAASGLAGGCPNRHGLESCRWAADRADGRRPTSETGDGLPRRSGRSQRRDSPAAAPTVMVWSHAGGLQTVQTAGDLRPKTCGGSAAMVADARDVLEREGLRVGADRAVLSATTSGRSPAARDVYLWRFGSNGGRRTGRARTRGPTRRC